MNTALCDFSICGALENHLLTYLHGQHHGKNPHLYDCPLLEICGAHVLPSARLPLDTSLFARCAPASSSSFVIRTHDPCGPSRPVIHLHCCLSFASRTAPPSVNIHTSPWCRPTIFLAVFHEADLSSFDHSQHQSSPVANLLFCAPAYA